MRFSEAHGRKVVSAEDAEALGTVEAYVINARERRITAVRVAKGKPDADLLSWEDLQLGPDAVIVSSSHRLRPPRDEAEDRAASKELQAVGKLVLDDGGSALGKVADIEFDPGSGAIVELQLDSGAAMGGDRLIGIGAYAVMVTRAAAGSLKEAP